MPPLTDVASVLAINFALTAASFVVLWWIGSTIKDVTFVDAWWAYGMGAVAIATYLQAKHGYEPRKLLLVGLTCAWAVRLGSYILWRWRTHGPDRRYVKMLERAMAKRGWSYPTAAFRMVFCFQAPLLWGACLAAQLGQLSAEPARIGVLGWTGAALAAFGILFETLADVQMVRFKADPANQGRVLDVGLWRYTRHPNYFGDICVWSGIYLVAAETALGVWALPGLAMLVLLLVKYSGGASYERRLTHSRPGYDAYQLRTSSLIPWPPKRSVESGV